MTHKVLTKKQAEHCLKLVRMQFSEYLSGDDSKYGPKLYAPGHEGPFWVIWWEEGPYEWALAMFHPWFDEELYDLAVGAGMTDEQATKMAEKPAVVAQPSWLFAEPVNGSCLGLYPA